MKRDELGMRRRVLGEEHPDTLATADTLVRSLACQGKYSCGGPPATAATQPQAPGGTARSLTDSVADAHQPAPAALPANPSRADAGALVVTRSLMPGDSELGDSESEAASGGKGGLRALSGRAL
jgi:hypothetical protein